MQNEEIQMLSSSITLTKLKKRLFFAYTFGFLLVLAFATQINKSRKIEVAQIVLSQIKENLVLRNIRPVFISLEEAITSSFNYVKFTDANNQSVFTLPPEYGIKSTFSLFNEKIILPIFLDKSDSGLQGKLEFGYSDGPIVVGAFLIWILLAALGVYLFSRYEKQLQREQVFTRKIKDAEISNIISKQVSHDIRSPLSALNMILGQLAQLPEAQRLIIRNSVNRINDIANELLTKGKQQHEAKTDFSKSSNHEAPLKLTTQLLSPLVDSLVSEKRVQFREKQGVEIEADINLSYGLFASINDTELKRTVSNLLNNSIEAFSDSKGRVIVSVRGDDKIVSIIVKDNGKGIPKHILAKLGEMGVSHGKEGTQSGSGIGVYHAKKTVESFGGRFEILSEEGLGTTITLSFPRAQAPSWFVEKLNFTPGMQIISVDDDLSVHNIWKGRFVSTRLVGNIEHLTFTSAIEFKNWFNANNSADALKLSRLYLVDFELLNQNTTGLDIIAELGIGPQSILVTSRYEEDHIRERCEKLGVRLIPKNMAGFVPMEIEKPKELFDAILIDDDNLVELVWKMSAEEKKKKLLYFSNPEDFFKQFKSFDLNCPIYVDSNLGNGIKGEDVSKKIAELGFKNVNICTGYQASQFPPMPWVQSIIGKDPIF